MLPLRTVIIKEPIEETYEDYLDTHQRIVYKDRDDKFVCLMDLALMAMKKLKKERKIAGSGRVR